VQIYVCVKHVPDTAATIRVTGKTEYDESVVFIINPYDEHAVEEALRLKERLGEGEVVAVTLGKPDAIKTLRSALAMGADRGIFICTDHYPDSMRTARALKAAIEQDGSPAIIFGGKESIDSEGMQTLFRLAAGMNMAAATNVIEFSMADGRVTVKCEREAGTVDVIEVAMPCVIGVGKGLNVPRFTKLQDIMKAKKKPLKEFLFSDLDLEKPAGTTIVEELQSVEEQRQARMLQGKPEEVVKQLVDLLWNEVRAF
jgi:electron transfer flavoprotein beta subunit